MVFFGKIRFCTRHLGEASYDHVFKGLNGKPVLNEAMGADKFKVVDGKTVELLRLICILVPINSYLRKLRGDINIFPFLPQMTLITLEPNEVLFTDSEDMMNCLNLLKMPDSWAGYFIFEKPVSKSAFGGDPNEAMCICELYPWDGLEQ